MISDDSDDERGGCRQKRMIRPSRGIYALRFFELTVPDLVSLAKSKTTLQFIKEFNKTWIDDSVREDALILTFGRTRGLEPFGLTVMRLPGMSKEMVVDQRAKLRLAARQILNSFKK